MAGARSIDCPSCGAPLQVQERQAIIICKFCRDTIRLDQPRAAPVVEPPPVVVMSPPVIRPRSAPYPASRPNRKGGLAGCGCSALFTVGMVVFVGGVLLFSGVLPLPAALRLSLQKVVPLNMIAFEGVTLSPSASDTLPEMVAFVQDNATSDLQRMLAKIDAEGQLVWRTKPFTEDSAYVFPNHIVPVDGAVYVALDDTLYAYQLSDGASLWQAALSDAAHPSCVQCVQVHGGHVIVLSMDGTIQAFSAATGDAEWSYTLQSTTYDLFDFGEQPAVIDREDAGSVLLFFDPATGAVTRRLQPACTHSSGSFAETLDTYDSTLLYDPASTALYLAFGTSEGCVQRWNLAAEDDRPEWEVHLTSDDGYSGVSDQTLLLSADTLYLSAGNGFVRAFDIQTGDSRLVLHEQDVDTALLGVQDGMALLRVATTRGTRKYALWGVDTATAEIRWRYSLGDAEPLSQAGDSSGAIFEDTTKWTWQLMSGRVQLVQVTGKPQQLSLQALALRDGAQSQTTPLPLSRLDSGSYSASVIGWRGSRLWLWIDYHLYRLNTETGQMEFIWP